MSSFFIGEIMDHVYRCICSFAGIPIKLLLEYDKSFAFFQPYIYKGDESRVVEHAEVTDSDWTYMEKQNYHRCAEIEISMLTAKVSDVLMTYDRAIIHSAAISFRGQAWLIAARPGVGKSTQAHFLQELYPGEFSVICGDRPILEYAEKNRIIVHPSPWNGKEGWKGAASAPLSGILCLERADGTSIQKMKKKDAVMPVFEQLICSRESEEPIKQLAILERRLLNSIPVYRYCNGGVPESTRILYQFLKEGLV